MASIKKMLVTVLMPFWAPVLLVAQPSPLTTELKDDSTTRIECDYTKNEKIRVDESPKDNSDNPAASKKRTGFHYDLYIPEGYNAATNTSYPCMFIASPNGKAAMGKMAARLKKDRWVVVMLVESKNNDNTWLANFLAAHDDVVKRVRIAEGAKFGTGLSGGARCCSTFPLLRAGFAGIICQSAGFAYRDTSSEGIIGIYKKFPGHVAVAGTFGTKDFNIEEASTIWTFLPPTSRKWVEVFEGGHEWCPDVTFQRAMDWIEETVFVDKPTKPTPNSFLLASGTGIQSMGMKAYQWYFDLLKRRAAATDSKYGKYLILLRQNIVAANGGLAGVSADAAELASIAKAISELRLNPEVQSEASAKTDYESIQKLYARIDEEMPKGKHEFNKKSLSANVERLFEGYFKACDQFMVKHPDSFYAKSVAVRKESLSFFVKPVPKPSKL